jgi:hypothetical protein
MVGGNGVWLQELCSIFAFEYSVVLFFKPGDGFSGFDKMNFSAVFVFGYAPPHTLNVQNSLIAEFVFMNSASVYNSARTDSNCFFLLILCAQQETEGKKSEGGRTVSAAGSLINSWPIKKIVLN